MNYISKTCTGRGVKRLLTFGIFLLLWGFLTGNESLFRASLVLILPCLVYILIRLATMSANSKANSKAE